MTYDQKIAYLTGNGLVRGVAFTSADLAGVAGDDIAFFFNAGNPTSNPAVIDSTVKASGRDSVKFTIPSLSGAGGSGQLTVNFSQDRLTQFGAGQTFWVQWQQKFDRYFFEHSFTGGGGWKLAIVTSGDPPVTCSPSDTSTCAQSHYQAVVVQNTNQRGFLQMYDYPADTGVSTPWEEVFGGDIKLQNAIPNPYCLYSTSGSGFPGCYKFSDGLASGGDQVTQWATITMQFIIGSLSSNAYVGSHVNVWLSWGGATEKQLFNWDLDLPANETVKTYGKIWFLPYHTGKDNTEVHTETYTWYANFIVATAAIPLTTDEVNRIAMVRR